MSAVVPYAMRYGRGPATSLGAYAWKNRRVIAGAAARSAWRSAGTRRGQRNLGKLAKWTGKRTIGAFKFAQRREVGESQKKGPAPKRYKLEEAGDAHNDKTLHTVGWADDIANMITVQRGTGTRDRLRDTINFNGVRLCMELQNTLFTPLYVNVACISSKDGSVPIVANFFRASDGSRSKNFSTALSGNELHCLPINTDIYAVHMHKRFLLPAANGNTGLPYRFNKRYIKIKRKIRFEGAGSTQVADGNLYLVHWGAQFGKPTTSVTPATSYTFGCEAVCYFREPGMLV